MVNCLYSVYVLRTSLCGCLLSFLLLVYIYSHMNASVVV